MSNKAQKDAEILRRAEEARQVLENPAYREAFMMLKSKMIERINRVSTKDSEKMRDAVMMLQNLNRVERIIETYYEKGKVLIDKKNKLGFFNNLT